MSKEFKTIDDIISDPIFLENVQKERDTLWRHRMNRKPAPPGFHYKRDWYDRMISQQQFTRKFFIENIPLIWIKKSALNSTYRQIILTVCEKALFETIKTYKEMEETPNEEPQSV